MEREIVMHPTTFDITSFEERSDGAFVDMTLAGDLGPGNIRLWVDSDIAESLEYADIDVIVRVSSDG